jgi:hypothetical protein
MTEHLPTPVAEFFRAVNTSDPAALLDTFVDDALVNDAQREFWGKPAIKAFSDRELFGDHVTLDIVKVMTHHGDPIVRAKCDGTFDKTRLPDPLILDFYFTLRADKIARLFIILNKPVQ